MNRVARIFLAGCITLLPLAVTLAAIGWLVSLLQDYLGPGSVFGKALISLGLSVSPTSLTPYIAGLLILLAAILVLGLIVESRLGPWLSAAMDALIMRIPVVSNVYDLSKRFTSIMDNKDGGNLKSMSPVWCFFGGEPGAAVLALLPSPKSVQIGKQTYVGILVPSAPVPVGGALIYVPQSWIKPAEGGVDQLMSVYVSMGVTPPKSQ